MNRLIPASFRSRKNRAAARLLHAAAPLCRLHARWVTGGGTTDPSRWRKVLILGDHHIGDALYRSCMLPDLAARLPPNTELHFLCSPESAAVLAGNPHLHRLWPCYHEENRSRLATEDLRQLRAEQFDAALILSCIRSLADIRLALKLGIPNRAGFVHKGLRGYITHPLPIDWPQPFARLFFEFVRLFDPAFHPPSHIQPHLYPDAQAQAAAAAFLRENQLGTDRAWLAVFPLSRQPCAQWPAAHFRALFGLLREAGVEVLLFGSAADEARLRELAGSGSQAPRVAAGALNLPALFALLRACPAALCVDSGPRHIANAAGCRVFFFRNLAAFAMETGAYAPAETDLCPAGENLSPAAQIHCLQHLSPEVVFQQLRPALFPHQH